MGGQKGGAAAAQAAIDALDRYLKDANQSMGPAAALQSALINANEAVHKLATAPDSDDPNMGSTAVVALISGGALWVGHVGDSRAYLVHEGRLRRLTKDHTAVQRLVDSNMISEEEARTHPDASRLVRALGPKSTVQPDVSGPHELGPGDGVMLCSDGLSGYVEDPAIEQAIRGETNGDDAAARLVDLATSAGAEDNITVQYMQFGGAAAPIDVRAPVTPEHRKGGRLISAWPAVIGALVTAVVAAMIASSWTRNDTEITAERERAQQAETELRKSVDDLKAAVEAMKDSRAAGAGGTQPDHGSKGQGKSDGKQEKKNQGGNKGGSPKAEEK